MTAPWTLAGRKVGRFTAPLALAAVAALAAIGLRARWRRWVLERLRSPADPIPPRAIAAFGALSAVFLLAVAGARYRGLAVNAWDFSVYFDLPLHAAAAALRSGASPFAPLLVPRGHAWFLMAAFVPLEAAIASPLWLVAAHALAVAAGAVAGFFFFRALLDDDPAALAFAAAFVLCSPTARAAQYVFHVEVFYPAAVFFVGWAWLRRRPVAFASGMLALLAIKEDAFLVAAGFAAASVFRKPGRRWAIAAAAAGALVFALEYRWALPRVSAGGPHPWYSGYWARFGPTPLRAGIGLLGHPAAVASALSGPGVRGLLEPLLFLPLAGWEWLVASLPALVPYATADQPKLARFALYYAMPVLPFLFAAAAAGVRRLARPDVRGPLAMRLGSLLVLAVAAFDGAGYAFPEARPERAEIRPTLAFAPPSTPIRVQGALLPHAGYDPRLAPLDSGSAAPDGRRGFLLDPSADPYPFRRAEVAALDAALSADARYTARSSAHGLRLFLPRAGDRIAP